MQTLRLELRMVRLPGEVRVSCRSLPRPPALAIWFGLMDATSNVSGAGAGWLNSEQGAKRQIVAVKMARIVWLDSSSLLDASHVTSLVLRGRFFYAVDHQDLDRTLATLKFKPELLL